MKKRIIDKSSPHERVTDEGRSKDTFLFVVKPDEIPSYVIIEPVPLFIRVPYRPVEPADGETVADSDED